MEEQDKQAQKKQTAQDTQKESGKFFTPLKIKIGAGMLAGLLVCTGGYFTLRNLRGRPDPGAEESVRTIVPSSVKTAAPATPTPERIGEFQALSSIRLADDYVLTYEYDGNTVTAKDSNGKTALTIVFNETGTVVEKQSPRSGTKEVFAYDADQRLTRKTILKYEPSGFPDHSYVCEYDGAGRLTTRSLYHSNLNAADRCALVAVSEFDRNGTLIRTTMEYEESPDARTTYAYELYDSGLLRSVRYIEYMSEDEVCCDFEYLYDENGNQNETKIRSATGNPIEAAETRIYDDTHTQMEHRREQVYNRYGGAMHVTGEFELLGYDYEFLFHKDGQLLPALFFGRGDAGAVSTQLLTADHTVCDLCDLEYDADGRVVKCAHDRDNSWYWAECEFDQKGRKIKEIHHIFGTGRAASAYEYDADGQLSKISMIQETTGRAYAEYLYDSQGRVSQYKSYGAVEAVLDFAYDRSGNAYMKKWSFRSADGALPLRSAEYLYDENYRRTGSVYCISKTGGYAMQEYDADGRQIKETNYTEDSVFRDCRVFVYDEHGWVIRCNRYDADNKLLSWTEYQNDEAGEHSDWETYTDAGKIQSKYAYEYDVSGKLAGRKVYREDGSSLCEYRYDRNGCVNGWKNYGEKRLGKEYTFRRVTDREYQIYARCNFEDLIVEAVHNEWK